MSDFQHQRLKRDEQIYKKIISGNTISSVAEEFNLHQKRVRQIFKYMGGDLKKLIKPKIV